MPYTQTTLAQYIAQIGTLMDDLGNVYWTPQEITYATYEALRVWGAYTNYWRQRGSFQAKPNDPSPWYDLSVKIPALRSRSYILNQMVQEMQYMLLENPSGVTGTGMSQQVSIGSILNAIQIARNRFVLDAHLPLSVHAGFASPPPQEGMVEFDQKTVFVHRVAWQDTVSGTWTNLWREDAWSIDKAFPQWTLNPGSPKVYSEAESAPLRLQIAPPPMTSGVAEALTVDSLTMSLGNPNTLFGVPDEWVHAIKYGALSYLLAGEGQIKDMTRAQYAEKRYQQAVDMAKDARSIIRLLANNVPLPIDSMMAIDAGFPYWRNANPAPPNVVGVLYDMVGIGPVDAPYGIAADVVRSAPLPGLNDPLQIGQEDLDHITDYVSHVLTFKCGGTDFTSTMGAYDSFMSAVGSRQGVNAAKIRYLEPLFGQPQREWQQRPDRIEVSNA